MNWIFRFCVALCMVAGVSMFGMACGDDNGNGGGDSCPEGQVSATVNGTEGCYEECSTADDCSATGAACNGGVCVGGTTNNGTNNGADAGNNGGTDGGNNGTTCGADEVEANPFGEGAACYATCSSNDDCTGAEECAELSDGTSICVEFPTGDATCSGILDCQGQCAQGDSACVQNCYFDGTQEAQDTMDALNQCYSDNCANSTEQSCLRDNCQAEVTSCAGCTGDEIEVNFACATPCTDGSECETDEECVEPYLGIVEAGTKVCSYSPEGIGGACADDPDCGGPDPDVTVQGGGFCSTQAPGGMCIPVGCNYGSQYGPNTGCGLEAICFEQQDSSTGQSFGLCNQLCRADADCNRGETADYACQILQDNAAGTLGLCGQACASDADCQFSGGTQGHCNASSYCELPCEGDGSCADAGGTCVDVDGTEYCSFESGT